jgi:hypothetical protein
MTGMRRSLAGCSLVFLVVGTACSGASVSPPTTTGSSASSPSVGPSSPPPSSPSASTSPVSLPPGVPPTYGGDQAAGDVPPASLVAPGATVTGTWFAPQGELTSIAVAYSLSGEPLLQEHGLVVWNEYPDAPRWRAVFGFRDKPSAGVLGVQAQTGDATGDGLAEVLTFESTGGSGSCGTYRVIAPSNGSQIFDETVCDTVIEIATHPAGLQETAAVFGPGDAHCCPSAQKVTRLRYTGSRWKVVSTTTIPIGP